MTDPQFHPTFRPKFRVGQIVHHKLFDYRGVVADSDPTCQAGDGWYDLQTQGSVDKPPKDAPWYHVLVDGATHTTYVAERNLEPADAPEPIDHPLVPQVFGSFLRGRYYREHLN